MPLALIVAEYGTLNGGENSLLAVIPDLVTAGFEIMAIVPEGSPFHIKLHELGVMAFPFDFTEADKDGLRKRKQLAALRAELNEHFLFHKPDVVHCNSLSATRICGPVCQAASIRSIGYFRDIIKLSKQAIRDVNCVDRIIAVSHATRAWHVAQGVDEHRIQVIHNGVDVTQFRPAQHSTDVRNELGLPSESPLVLFVGQIGLRKGLDTWLAAAEEIVETHPATHFLIVGERNSGKQESIDHEQSLIAFSQQGPLKNQVHWLGRRTDVATLMRQSTLLLHCARQEPLGRVILESIASGLPVVATNVGGTAEILCTQMLSGFLVPVDEANSAANAAIRLLTDPNLRDEIAHEVQRVAIQHFPVSACSKQLLAAYSDVLTTDKTK